MGYEIDFLPVGSGERSGDAILMRWGDLYGYRDRQTVVAVDGGFDDTTGKIVEHLNRYYRTDRVDLVVSTHPDADHINGLRGLLREVKVEELWMHLPWNHSLDPRRYQIQRSLGAAQELEQIARSRGIPIKEPFRGVCLATSIGTLCVMGPSVAYYRSLLPQFAGTGPTPTAAARAREGWYTETLNDEGETTAENNSSTILGFLWMSHYLLLTGDAGIPALSKAADVLQAHSLLQKFEFIQIPHHGSKRNVGPTILNRILGSKVSEGQRRGIAFVSSAPDGLPKHPHRKVTNAFTRRGYAVYKTAGSRLWHSYQAPVRPGYPQPQSLPLYTYIEDD